MIRQIHNNVPCNDLLLINEKSLLEQLLGGKLVCKWLGLDQLGSVGTAALQIDNKYHVQGQRYLGELVPECDFEIIWLSWQTCVFNVIWRLGTVGDWDRCLILRAGGCASIIRVSHCSASLGQLMAEGWKGDSQIVKPHIQEKKCQRILELLQQDI